MNLEADAIYIQFHECNYRKLKLAVFSIINVSFKNHWILFVTGLALS